MASVGKEQARQVRRMRKGVRATPFNEMGAGWTCGFDESMAAIVRLLPSVT